MCDQQPIATRAYATAPTTQVTTLPSGLRVATESNASQTATIGAFVNTGSVYETAKTNGVAHFLEHMAFKVSASTKSAPQQSKYRKRYKSSTI
jgi:predicted Zn-dependent peptidase